MRFYEFTLPELASALSTGGMLDLNMDPKLGWALVNRAQFPVDVNTAPREMLLRVPGLGTRAVDRIVASRRHGALRLADVARLTVSIAKIRPFIIPPDWQPGRLLDAARLQ
jgi:predicted DNA-binding helix-hairpin-helix protein